jgi:hypothetical protein
VNKEEQQHINKNSFWQQNKGSITTGAKTSHQVKIGECLPHNFHQSYA